MPLGEAAAALCLSGGPSAGKDINGVGQEIGSDRVDDPRELGQHVKVVVRLGEVPADLSGAFVESPQLGGSFLDGELDV